MQKHHEKIWATVPHDIYRQIEAVQNDMEETTCIRPSVGQVVLSLIKKGLKKRPTANSPSQSMG